MLPTQSLSARPLAQASRVQARTTRHARTPKTSETRMSLTTRTHPVSPHFITLCKGVGLGAHIGAAAQTVKSIVLQGPRKCRPVGSIQSVRSNSTSDEAVLQDNSSAVDKTATKSGLAGASQDAMFSGIVSSVCMVAVAALLASAFPTDMAIAASKSSAAPALTDCSGAAAGVLGNIRIPATLLAGAAMSNLWEKLEGPENAPWLKTAFSVLMSMTVMLEFMAVFIATAMGVRFAGGGFDPMAANAVELLVREFELQFLATRFCFFTGLLAFTFSFVMRAVVTLPKNVAKATGLIYTAGLFQMLACFNSTVMNYKFGYLGVFCRIVTLSAAACLKDPIALASVLCMLGAAFYTVCAFKPELEAQVSLVRDKGTAQATVDGTSAADAVDDAGPTGEKNDNEPVNKATDGTAAFRSGLKKSFQFFKRSPKKSTPTESET